MKIVVSGYVVILTSKMYQIMFLSAGLEDSQTSKWIHGIRWKGSGMVNGRKGWKREVREEKTKGDKKEIMSGDRDARYITLWVVVEGC